MHYVMSSVTVWIPVISFPGVAGWLTSGCIERKESQGCMNRGTEDNHVGDGFSIKTSLLQGKRWISVGLERKKANKRERVDEGRCSLVVFLQKSHWRLMCIHQYD